MPLPNRREFVQCLLYLSGLGGWATLAAETHPRPFCRYSLSDGWSGDAPRGEEYIDHKAGSGDRSGVPQVVARIEQCLNFRAAIDVFIAEQEDNASATIANGRKVLVVDVDFLEKIDKLTGTQWAGIQVIAHEIGHHIAGFAANSHSNELNADYWSGQALQRLGSSLPAATKAILTVGTELDTDSHPNKYRRRDVITQGWQDSKAGTVDYSHCLDCR